MEKKHIVCFGDSNTHGYRATDNSRHIQRGGALDLPTAKAAG